MCVCVCVCVCHFRSQLLVLWTLSIVQNSNWYKTMCRKLDLFLSSGEGGLSVKSQVFMAVTMKNTVFWDVTPCCPCKNRRYGGTYRLHHQGGKIRRARNHISMYDLRFSRRWLWRIPFSGMLRRVDPESTDVFAAYFGYQLLPTLFLDRLFLSSETSVFMRAVRRHIPDKSSPKHSILSLKTNNPISK
jgi:hypothetical protein